MESELMLAGISLLGTMVGTGGGIIISSKLTNYRLSQLEKKMDKHNNFIERVFILEEQTANMKDDICENKTAIHDLEKGGDR